ncbi:MAG: hypothetical protein KDB61_09335, partial [Planctomycetes bacterium]|nr:hypothetical protein [Planctomycetota bacterium]
MKTLALGALAALASLTTAHADVLHVGSNPGDFADIQSAINAASEGDTILVEPSQYDGFTVDGKSLTIIPSQVAAVFQLLGPVHL